MRTWWLPLTRWFVASPGDGGTSPTSRRSLGAVAVVAVLGAGGLAGCAASAPPVIGTAVAGDGGAVTVSWSPPVVSEVIVAYLVTPHPVGAPSLPRIRFDSAATTQTVTGLTNGVTYTFTVQAVNALGHRSAASEESNPVTVTDLAAAIGAGDRHSCALRAGGTIACWGDNSHRQLGYGTIVTAWFGPAVVPPTSSTPVTVTGITDATAIAAGKNHTCALRAGGTVSCWGDNPFGQLGNGSTTPSLTPVAVTGITDATAITAGARHSCALLAGGTISCWGDNGVGQLGNGTDTPSPTPVGVTGVTDATAITAGALHSCAVLADQSIACWGRNHAGQLGNGTFGGGINAWTPVAVTGITDAIAISAGYDFSCAVLAGGSAKCWGDNFSGQVGNGTTSSVLSPVLSPVTVIGITDATAITSATTGTHSCALLASGNAKCWGYNVLGQLGNGTRTNASTPVTVTGIADAAAITAGTSHTCALLAGGTSRCWGNSSHGQLGNGAVTISSTPLTVSGITDATAIATGGNTSCALRVGGTVACWGQLWANGPRSSTPVTIAGITDATAISTGGSHTCALLADGTIRCWGYNFYGQLGNGTTNTISPTPVTVTGITDATAIATGTSHTCALLADGTARCWGYNLYGQLGNGTTTGSATPVAVNGITDATAISAGAFHTCALLADGTITCWGSPGSSIPVAVAGITDAIAVTTGYSHSCALRADATATCWGDNPSGQLGNGTTTSSATPVAVSGITDATAIAAGASHTCARRADATTTCWGDNVSGQLGYGATVTKWSGPEVEPGGSSTPVPVTGITGAPAVATGGSHTCALLPDATARCWGLNDNGQLGFASPIIPSSIPVTVVGL